MNKETKKEKKLSKVAEGSKAVAALYEALDKDGLLVDGEKDALKDRIVKLEHEVSLLKDLVAGALQVKSDVEKNVLKG